MNSLDVFFFGASGFALEPYALILLGTTNGGWYCLRRYASPSNYLPIVGRRDSVRIVGEGFIRHNCVKLELPQDHPLLAGIHASALIQEFRRFFKNG
jgi:hypothetical protein